MLYLQIIYPINNISHNKLTDIKISCNNFLPFNNIPHKYICFFIPKDKNDFFI